MFTSMTPDEQQREIARLDYEQFKEEATVRLGIQQTLGLAAINGVTLVNGGALIALFTFIGNASKTVRFDYGLLWMGFGCFTFGLILAVSANLLGYLMQVHFYVATVRQAWNAQHRSLGAEPKEDIDTPIRIASRFSAAAVIAAILSLICFCGGAGLALAGVTALK